MMVYVLNVLVVASASSVSWTFHEFRKVTVGSERIYHINELSVGAVVYILLEIELLLSWIQVWSTAHGVQFDVWVNVGIQLWSMRDRRIRLVIGFDDAWILNFCICCALHRNSRGLIWFPVVQDLAVVILNLQIDNSGFQVLLRWTYTSILSVLRFLFPLAAASPLCWSARSDRLGRANMLQFSTATVDLFFDHTLVVRCDQSDLTSSHSHLTGILLHHHIPTNTQLLFSTDLVAESHLSHISILMAWSHRKTVHFLLSDILFAFLLLFVGSNSFIFIHI